MEKFRQILLSLSERPTTLLEIVGAFLGAVAFRVFVENFFATSSAVLPYEIIIEFLHDVYFFSISFLLIWIFLSYLLKVKPQSLSRLFLWGTLFIILPPIIDMTKTKGAVFWSFYVLGSLKEIYGNFLTFFGQLPPGIVYFGTKIVFILTILLFAIISYLYSKKYWKAFLGAFGTYVLLFLMGAFPTFFYFVFNALSGGRELNDIRSFQIAQFFGSPVEIFGLAPQVVKYTFVYNLNFIYFPFLTFLLLTIFFMIDRKKTLAFLRNARFPQLIYHSGLFFIGIGLGFLAFRDNFDTNVFSLFAALTLLISIWLSWLASVVVNDIYDLKIDEISNQARPLPQGLFTPGSYASVGILCFILAIIGSLSVGFIFAALLFFYQLLAWFYSAEPFRVKKYPLLATFISALAALLVLFMGYVLLSSDQTIYSLSWRIILLLLITYTISLPIKDFKDIEGDRRYQVWTWPVILGEKKGRLIVAVSIFVSYMLSVFFLNEFDLFWWAVVFGSASFLIMNSQKIKPRRLPAWILGTVSVYTLILVWIVFLDK